MSTKYLVLTGLSLREDGVRTYKVHEFEYTYSPEINISWSGEYVLNEIQLGEVLEHRVKYRLFGIAYNKISKNYAILNMDKLPVWDYYYHNMIKTGKKMIVSVLKPGKYVILDENGKLRYGDDNDIELDELGNFNLYTGYISFYGKTKTFSMLNTAYMSRHNQQVSKMYSKMLENNELASLLGLPYSIKTELYKNGNDYIEVVTGVNIDRYNRDVKTIRFTGKYLDIDISDYVYRHRTLDFRGMTDAEMFRIHSGRFNVFSSVYGVQIILPERLKCKAEIDIRGDFDCDKGIGLRSRIDIVNAEKLIFSKFIIGVDATFNSTDKLSINIDGEKKEQPVFDEITLSDFGNKSKGMRTNIGFANIKFDSLNILSRYGNESIFFVNCAVGNLKCEVFDKKNKNTKYTPHILSMRSYFNSANVVLDDCYDYKRYKYIFYKIFENMNKL